MPSGLLRVLADTAFAEVLDDSSLHREFDEIEREEPNNVL
jgi:hypothetical protein